MVPWQVWLVREAGAWRVSEEEDSCGVRYVPVRGWPGVRTEGEVPEVLQMCMYGALYVSEAGVRRVLELARDGDVAAAQEALDVLVAEEAR